MERLPVLIHTFNSYRHLWPGMVRGLEENLFSMAPIYWGTDIRPEYPKGELNAVAGMPCDIIFSGEAEWSDRLRRLLVQIPADYVLYMQEDHWPSCSPPDLSEMMEIVTQNNLLRLQLSPATHFYKLIPGQGIQYFDPYSKYLVSHQPSIWKKSFLLDCLRPNETPWVNEYKGTLRLQQSSVSRAFIDRRIAIYPCDWFTHKCVKGKVVE